MSDTLTKPGNIAGIDPDRLYTIAQTEAILGVHHHTIRRAIKSGRLQAAQIGGGPWTILGRNILRLVGADAA